MTNNLNLEDNIKLKDEKITSGEKLKKILNKLEGAKTLKDITSLFNTEIKIYGKNKDKEYQNELGELLFTGKNMVTLQGLIFLAQKITGLSSPISDDSSDPLTVGEQLQLQESTSSLTVSYTEPTTDLTLATSNADASICLFGIGTSGAGTTLGDVYSVSLNTKAIESNSWLNGTSPTENTFYPIRIVPTDSTELNSEGMLDGYAVRQNITYNNTDYYAFMFKVIDGGNIECVINSTSGSGSSTPVTAGFENYSSDQIANESTYIDYQLTISTTDGREYFEYFCNQNSSGENVGTANARINTLGLLTGVPITETVSGTTSTYTEYGFVQLFSKLNFNNISIDDDTTQLTIIYRIYLI